MDGCVKEKLHYKINQHRCEHSVVYDDGGLLSGRKEAGVLP